MNEDTVDTFTSSGYSQIEDYFDEDQELVIVYSKEHDSLPVTTFRVDYEPCVEYWKQSSAPYT